MPARHEIHSRVFGEYRFLCWGRLHNGERDGRVVLGQPCRNAAPARLSSLTELFPGLRDASVAVDAPSPYSLWLSFIPQCLLVNYFAASCDWQYQARSAGAKDILE